MFLGAKKSKMQCTRASPVRAHLEGIRVWQGNNGNRSRKCPRTLPKRRYFHMISRGVGKWQLETLRFHCVLGLFLAHIPFLGQKSARGANTLYPVRTPGCGFRCFSWKIAFQNHQYSLGFNWYLERGDDGKWTPKGPRNTNDSVGFCILFRGNRKTSSGKYQ